MNDKNHGMIGKRNAAKPDEEKKLGNVHVRCNMDDKSGWVKTAKAEGLTLAGWIIKVLNAAKKF